MPPHAYAVPVPNSSADANAPPFATVQVVDEEKQEDCRQQEPPFDYLGAIRRASPDLPVGLARACLKSAGEFSLRIWVVDNSVSMSTCDGRRLVRDANGAVVGTVKCSRWDELAESLRWHARIAVSISSPLEFRLLNTPRTGERVVSVGFGHPEQELAAVETLIAGGPIGATPLRSRLNEVVLRIESHARAGGQRACVVIASDGESSDGDIKQPLDRMKTLPVAPWVIIRLCTNEDSIIDYWNKIDEELEIDLDVLDDLRGEAAEVRGMNGWLAYGAPMHMLREWGTTDKTVDLLDERRLTSPEMRAIVSLTLIGPDAADADRAELPHPEIDWRSFERAVRVLLASESPVYCPRRNPLRRSQQPWFNLRAMKRKYRPLTQGGCLPF